MKKHKLIIVVSMVLGLVVAAGFYFYMQGLRNEMKKPEPEKIVSGAKWVVATVDIPFRELLTADMVEEVNVPYGIVQEGAITRKENAVGRAAVAPIMKGQFLLDANLKSITTGSDLGYTLPAGYRAITIETNIVSGVGEMLKPDDLVDMIIYLDEKRAGEDVSFVLYRGLRILATDQNMRNAEAPKEESGALATTIGGSKKGYVSVTLAATPEQCVKINLAESIGRMRLVLRSSENMDVTEAEVPVSVPASLISQFGIQVKKEQAASRPTAAAAKPARTRAAKPVIKVVRPPYESAPAPAMAATKPAAPEGRRVTVMRGMDVSTVINY